MKTLVIINGVTGALGQACLARFSRECEVTIIGLSRQALSSKVFCAGSYLPDNTFICSIGDISNGSNCDRFASGINKDLYKKIIYIHAVGVYPFELDGQGKVSVSNDQDGDGIDDRVVKLSYDAFFTMVNSLATVGLPVRSVIFGGIADKFRPVVHKSWWTVMGKIKERIKKEILSKKEVTYFILNISSVMCSNELITRPFVFQNTNADGRFWVTPQEVAEKVFDLTFSSQQGFVEDELFHKADYYEIDYFTDKKFTVRKKAELGL